MARYKNRFFASVLAVVFSFNAMAPEARAASNRGPASSGARYLLYVAPGLVVGGGSTWPGIGASFLTRLTPNLPLFVGGDTGMYFRTSPFADLIPILPAAVYKYSVSSEYTPYLGVDLGPVVTLGNGSGVDVGMFLKPGIEFNTDPRFDIFLEVRLGVIASTFLFFPHLGAIFRL